MKPALIIGSTCVDVILRLDHLPATAEDLHPESQSMALGGCAYNVAYMMHLLNAPHTFISPVGSGIYGNYVAEQLTAMGMPVSVRVPDKENGCCYCLVEASGERTFLSFHGVEYTFDKAWMEPYDSHSFGLTYLCGLEVEEPTGIHLISWLEEHPELQIFYAPGPRGKYIDPEKNSRIMKLHPILHINQQESLELSGMAHYTQAAAWLYQQTNNTIIITLGEQGCFYMDKNKNCNHIPAVPVSHIKDTIGAGDAHAGTLLACLTKDIPLPLAAAYANQVAGAVISVAGASLPAHLLPSKIAEISSTSYGKNDLLSEL